jgi:uncharacterized protein (UPF0332 family)
VDEDTRVIIRVRVAKAREDVETARELVALGRYRVAATRSYYAIFTITTAVLLTQGLARDKHTGVQSAFGEHFVQSGQIQREYGRIFTVARKAREESDYADQLAFTREYAEKHLADAERFVARMEQYLKDVGAI